MIGLALLAMAVVGEPLARVLQRPAARVRPLLLVAALSAAATLLNPHGLEALLYPLSYAGGVNASMRYVAEWQSPNFHNLQDGHLLMFATSLLLAIVLGLGRRPLGPTELSWALFVGLMALQSLRHIPLWAVLAMPLIGARLQAEVPALRRSLSDWRRPTLLAVTWPLLVLSVVRLTAAGAEWDDLGLGQEPGSRTYPAAAVESIRAHQLDGNLFHAYDWGGYLIYQLYPEQRVFVDGRADPYGDELMERYMEVALLRPGWRQVLDEYDVRLVLVEKDSVLAVALAADDAWQEVSVGLVERLFARREPRPTTAAT